VALPNSEQRWAQLKITLSINHHSLAQATCWPAGKPYSQSEFITSYKTLKAAIVSKIASVL
jgi:hypothetical protein